MKYLMNYVVIKQASGYSHRPSVSPEKYKCATVVWGHMQHFWPEYFFLVKRKHPMYFCSSHSSDAEKIGCPFFIIIFPIVIHQFDSSIFCSPKNQDTLYIFVLYLHLLSIKHVLHFTHILHLFQTCLTHINTYFPQQKE